MMPPYEKLGAFYLGKAYDLPSRALREDLILYDSKDLTTHAVIIGMTGSGKTGLGIGMIEEALIDNIPVIAVDPKGDLPNLLLTFPGLSPGDFKPWVNPQDAVTRGLSLDQYAAHQATLWQRGLADWGQDPERIARLKNAADFTVYTPGSSAGVPVSVLRSFAPPPRQLLEDPDLLRERIQTLVTGLLSLLGVESDPITSREHILMSNLLETAWAENRTLDLAGLIQSIQRPPFTRVGVMDLDLFFPAGDRFALAMRLNNLLAAPGFDAWMQGEPLDVERLLYSPGGGTRAAVFSISHLSEPQRMFFVSALFNEVLGWVRTQPGTTSLRAVLYMDEIFGFLPPLGNPPSKAPLLTLLKQARAYGLGVVLSTQNPVDLDYKALSNAGTWFIGRLQTERDKDRVLAGLEGAAAGSGFQRGRMSEILAGLGKRVFFMHNVHESQPAVFQTRWTLSYLGGPMTRDQIKALTATQGARTRTEPAAAAAAALPDATATQESPAATVGGPPTPPPGLEAYHLAASGAGAGLVYRPAMIGRMDIHYANARHGVNTTETLGLAAAIQDGPVPLDWDHAIAFDPSGLETEPMDSARFAPLPSAALKAETRRKWQKDLLRWVRQNRPLTLYQAKAYGMTSGVGETEGAFRARLGLIMRERRDVAVEKLRAGYTKRFTSLRDRLIRAEQSMEREQDQVKSSGMQTAITFGTAILGAFLGRKVVSSGSAYRVGTAMKSASRMHKEKKDVARAAERAESIRQQLTDLDSLLQTDIEDIEASHTAESADLETVRIQPNSTDITLELFALGWLPYRRDAGGGLSPDWK